MYIPQIFSDLWGDLWTWTLTKCYYADVLIHYTNHYTILETTSSSTVKFGWLLGISDGRPSFPQPVVGEGWSLEGMSSQGNTLYPTTVAWNGEFLIISTKIAGWSWDDYWLVVWLPFFIFPYIGLLIIEMDFHIFQRGGPTTNQIKPFHYSNGRFHRSLGAEAMLRDCWCHRGDRAPGARGGPEKFPPVKSQVFFKGLLGLDGSSWDWDLW